MKPAQFLSAALLKNFFHTRLFHLRGNAKMKMIDEASLLQNRRRILFALVMSPLILYSYTRGRRDRSAAMTNRISGDFVIVNGWVLLKQDLAEDREHFG